MIGTDSLHNILEPEQTAPDQGLQCLLPHLHFKPIHALKTNIA